MKSTQIHKAIGDAIAAHKEESHPTFRSTFESVYSAPAKAPAPLDPPPGTRCTLPVAGEYTEKAKGLWFYYGDENRLPRNGKWHIGIYGEKIYLADHNYYADGYTRRILIPVLADQCHVEGEVFKGDNRYEYTGLYRKPEGMEPWKSADPNNGINRGIPNTDINNDLRWILRERIAKYLPVDYLPETAQFIADMNAAQKATRKHSIFFGPIPEPEHLDGEPCTLPVDILSVHDGSGLRFEYVEKRPYEKNEWIETSVNEIMLTNHGHTECLRWILRAIPDPEEPLVTVLTFDREGKEGSYTFRGKPDKNRIAEKMKADGIPAVIVLGWHDDYEMQDRGWNTAIYEKGLLPEEGCSNPDVPGYSGWSYIVPSTDIKSSLIAAIKKAYPSKWTPKVGGYAYSTGCPCEVLEINGKIATLRPLGKSFSPIWQVNANALRRLTAEDWKVDVEGVGKVWAWYDKAGDLYLESNGSPGHFPQCDPFHWKLGHKFCRDNNLPIMPYGWKEEKGKRVSDE